MTKYSAEWGDGTITMEADFSQSSCQIIGDPCGRQVADFSHRTEDAMRAIVEHEASAEGFDLDDPQTIVWIDDAVASMTED